MSSQGECAWRFCPILPETYSTRARRTIWGLFDVIAKLGSMLPFTFFASETVWGSSRFDGMTATSWLMSTDFFERAAHVLSLQRWCWATLLHSTAYGISRWIRRFGIFVRHDNATIRYIDTSRTRMKQGALSKFAMAPETSLAAEGCFSTHYGANNGFPIWYLLSRNIYVWRDRIWVAIVELQKYAPENKWIHEVIPGNPISSFPIWKKKKK